jgi:hypothetical protein
MARRLKVYRSETVLSYVVSSIQLVSLGDIDNVKQVPTGYKAQFIRDQP